MKAAIAQIKTRATRFDHNYNAIVSNFDRARAHGAELVVFPELTIPGYLAHDNFLNPAFLEENVRVLQAVVEHTRGTEVTAIVGFANPETGPEAYLFRKPFNSAAVIRNGEVRAIVNKTLLPDYDIFWEPRYFQSSSERHAVRLGGRVFGVEICEDLWDSQYPIKVTDELMAQGVQCLINLSCSPFQAGKYRAREKLIRAAVARHKVPFLYANQIAVQDGYDGELVFDGRSLIVGADGAVLAAGRAFAEDLLFADFANPAGAAGQLEWTPVEEIYQALIIGLQEYCARNGFERVYIGLSGGIDSSVAAALAVIALGKERVVGVTMPSHITSTETRRDALDLAARLGIRCDERPIEGMYRAWLKSASEQHPDLLSITRQNVQARIRGQILMEYTNQDRCGMVVTTGNKTELALGYCTLYGDMCGGLALIGDVSKLMVYELASHINAVQGRELICESVIRRVPTAELEEHQTDRDNLPADYPVLSPLVDDIIEGSLSADALLKKYPGNVVEQTVRLIHCNEYKRRQAPPAVRVTSKSFGAGRRYPIDNRFSGIASAFRSSADQKGGE